MYPLIYFVKTAEELQRFDEKYQSRHQWIDTYSIYAWMKRKAQYGQSLDLPKLSIDAMQIVKIFACHSVGMANFPLSVVLESEGCI